MGFSACGEMGAEASVVVKKLASSLAAKRNKTYSRIVAWIRCCLAFALARLAIRCIRGSRSLRRRALEIRNLARGCRQQVEQKLRKKQEEQKRSKKQVQQRRRKQSGEEQRPNKQVDQRLSQEQIFLTLHDRTFPRLGQG